MAMPRVCTVCQHPNYHQIDVWIIEGVSANEIARRTGLGKHAVRRHRQAGLHLRSPTPLTEDQEATVKRRVDNIVRDRSYRAVQKRAAEAVPAYEPPPEPPPPPPAKPEPVNPPNKLFTMEEAMRLQTRARANLRRPLRPPGSY
jgi:hypothetical protein